MIYPAAKNNREVNMSHFKLAKKEIEMFVLSMKIHRKKIDEEHPHSDIYEYLHPVSKQIRYLDSLIGKMENELKVRSMRPHKVTVQGLDLKKLRTIRWDGTCKKCGVRSYFPRVRVNGIWKLMCILCYWRAKKDV